jgi:exoribonuclease R
LAPPDGPYAEGSVEAVLPVVFSIDPARSFNLDDALSYQPLTLATKDGSYPRIGSRVGIHISDVASFVKQYSAVDVVAREQVQTTYFADGSMPLPMFPDDCGHRCSLIADGRPRLVLSLLADFDDKGRLMDVNFIAAATTVTRNLTYADAEAIIMDSEAQLGESTEIFEGTQDPYVSSRDEDARIEVALRALHTLTVQLRNARDTVELGGVNIQVRKAEGQPWAVTFEAQQAEGSERAGGAAMSHAMVEELMLLYNMQVAKWLLEKGQANFALRVQPAPTQARLWEFWEMVRTTLHPPSGSKVVNSVHSPEFDSSAYLRPNVDALASATTCPPGSRQLVKALTARHFPAPRAFYAAPADPEQLHPSTCTHYCLNATVVHATAPIRRYVDVLVQRSLLSTLALSFEADAFERDGRAVVPIEKVLASANLRSSMLRDAERDATRWSVCLCVCVCALLFEFLIDLRGWDP